MKLLSLKNKSNFIQNTFYMLNAGVIGQIIALLSMPILSRLFAPEDFGQFALFTAVTAIIVSVATFRFDWSIPNARTNGIAAAIMKIAFLCVLITCLCLAIVICLPIFFGNVIFQFNGIGYAVYFLPLAILSSSIIEIFYGWHVRREALKHVGSIRIIQSISNSFLTMIAGLMNIGAMGIIGASIISGWIGVTIFLAITERINHTLKRAKLNRMILAYWRYRREATLSTAVSLTNAMSSTASIFLVSNYFTVQELGWFALMQRLALMPVGLISSAIGTSFWATASALARKDSFIELRSLHLRTTKMLSISIVPIVICCALAPYIIGPLLGSTEWTPAGYILFAMAPHIIGAMVFAPTNHLIVYGKQSYQLASDLLSLALTVLSVLISVHWNLNIIICTLLISSSMLLSYILRFWLHLYANSLKIYDCKKI
jgi:O-antigen/teichoic acid export membrane protein